MLLKTHLYQRNTGVTTAILLLCSFVFSSSAVAGHGENTINNTPNNTPEPTDQVIVKYRSNSALNNLNTQASAAINRASARSGMPLNQVRRMHTGAYIMRLAKASTQAELNQLLDTLNSDPDVEYAEADLILKPMATPDDSRYNEQWHYFEPTAGLNLPDAWDITQGTGAVVAVLDTGYRPHIDLQSNILPGYDMISDTSVSQDGNGRDNDARDPGDWEPAGACGSGSSATDSSWHGTHVAGTIAAVSNNSLGVSGVAYAAKIVPVRVLGRCGGYTSDIADGIIWAAGGTVSGLPVNANPANVINMSLGGAGSCGFTQQNAINTARSLGASVVVAAGNESVNASNSNPANCTGVIAVAAINRNGGRAFYSNYGSVVDVAAPGGDLSYGALNGILSTLNSGRTTPGSDSYAFYQGTSMATPHVAGVAALLYSVKPSITPDEVEQTLKLTSRAFPASCSQCGSGIVDAAAAVNSLGTVTPPVQTTVLLNGVSVGGLSATTGNELAYTFEVPAGATDLKFTMSGGSGDADLYIKYASAATTNSYDCRPYIAGNNEVCSIPTVQAGTYHVMLRAYSSFSNTSIIASYTEPGAVTGFTQTGLSASTGQWKHYTLNVPAGMASLNAVMDSGTGDADLYVRFGAAPTASAYNCRPYKAGNNETCVINSPQAGTWYISVYAYSSYAGTNLQASYLP